MKCIIAIEDFLLCFVTHAIYVVFIIVHQSRFMIAHYYLLLRYDLTPTLLIIMHDVFYYLIISLVFIDFLTNNHTCFTFYYQRPRYKAQKGATVFNRTFLISNLTPKLIFVFTYSHFLIKNHTQAFFSYFVFPFKNKTKISGDSKSFLKIKFSLNK